MKEVRRVAELIASVDHGDPWHGSSTRGVLEGVTARDAAERPIPNAHTIWEIVLHMTAWTREVRKRAIGGAPGMPEEGDWPEAPGSSGPAGSDGATPRPGATPVPNEGAWASCIADLAAAHAALVAALEGFPGAKLDELVGLRRDLATGTGTSYGAMLYGVALHDAYHSGQITLLKRAIAQRA